MASCNSIVHDGRVTQIERTAARRASLPVAEPTRRRANKLSAPINSPKALLH